MSGEIEIRSGNRFSEIDPVTVDGVNALFSGMTAKVRPGSVGTRELADGAVTAAKLSDAVSEAIAIPDGSITTAKLADGCLSADDAGRAKMEDGFVTAAELGALAVTTAKLADGAVTAGKLAGGVDVGRLRNEQADVDGAQGTRYDTQTWSEIMSVAITPSSTSSKVLVVFSGVIGSAYRQVDYPGPTYREQQAAFKITRTVSTVETNLLMGDASGSRGSATGACRNGVLPSAGSPASSGIQVHCPYLDSPATVSAVTYRVYIREALASTWGVFGPNSSSSLQSTNIGRQPKSSLVVLEVMQA